MELLFILSFAAAVAITILLIIPSPLRIRGSLFGGTGLERSERPLADRIRQNLRKAGIFDQAPSLFVIAMIAASVVLGIVFVFLSKSLITAIFAPIIVVLATQLYIHRRQKQFLTRAIDDLIPFLNRIATSVRSKQPIRQAYLEAVSEAGVLREILGPSAAKIVAGAPFTPTLVETIPVLPLRMWANFVRQVELFENVGGDMTTGVERSVNQINQMLQLQAETRADYASMVKQQQAIMVILLVGILGYMLIVPGGMDRVKILVTEPAGVVGLIIGLAVIAFGISFLNKQLRDVDRKLSF